MTQADDARRKLHRDRFAQGQEATKSQRDRELDALKFYAGEHWPDDIKIARQGQQAVGGLPAVPARPCLVFDTLREPVRAVLNQERALDLGIEIVAADDFGGQVGPLADDEIELREGLVRRIQRQSEAKDARTWAFNRAAICGTGAYRITTRYVPGKTFDQEIVIERIFNGASVTWDPAHTQPDGSDADWVYIGMWMPWDQYVTEFGRRPIDQAANPVAGYDEDQFLALGERMPAWFRSEGADQTTRVVHVVECYSVVRKTRELWQLTPDPASIVWKDELGDTNVTPFDRRTEVIKTILWEKLDGMQVLDKTEWQGPDIPVVKVVYDELQPFDDDRRVDGMVQPAKSSAQGLDYMISKWVETIGLQPIPPWLVAEGQVDAFRNWWDQANTRTFPFLPYRTRDAEGNPVGPPQRTPIDAPIADLAASVQLFREMQKATTGVPTVSLGEVDPGIKSGKAIRELLTQSQNSTSHGVDNLVRSMRYEGQIINHLLYPIYGKRPGRMVSIINGLGESETRQLATAAPDALAAAQKVYRLTPDARFNVAIKVAKSFDTRRQQEADIVGNIVAQNPDAMMPVYGDIFFKNLDGPGHMELAERAKLVLDPRVQKALAAKANEQSPVPPEVQAIIDSLSAQNQQLMQAIETKQVEQQAKIQVEQIAAQKDLELERMRAATSIAVAKINALAKGIVVDGQAQNEATAQAMQLSHEAAQAALDREMQATEARAARQSAADEAEQQRAHERDTATAQQIYESGEKAKDRAVANAAEAS